MGSDAAAACGLRVRHFCCATCTPGTGQTSKKASLMHTAIVIGIGLVALVVCLYLGHLLGAAPGLARAALVFLPLWLSGAAINMFIGVRSAGYAVTEEAPVMIVVFALPAALALVAWWRF